MTNKSMPSDENKDMQIIEITDKKQLNDFVGGEKHSQFLQSWEWGEFQSKVAGQIIRLGAAEGDRLAAAATLVKKALPLGKSYFYCGRGPVVALNFDKKEITGLLFNKIKELAESAGAMFLRFEPVYEFKIFSKFGVARTESPSPGFAGEAGQPLFGKLRTGSLAAAEAEPARGSKLIISKTLDVQPSQTLILDLTKSEDEILRAMNQKTRYNIKLAGKKGVKILESGLERFEEFWQLMAATSNRDEFSLPGRNYYKEMLKFDSGFLKLFFAKYRGQLLAANLTVFFGDTATYIHGGSANEDRNAMAPYLLQWHSIKLAKANGQKYYDFYGINEVKWSGITRFKNGFGGLLVNYPGTFDLVYNQSWYNIYKMVRKIRRTF